MAGHVKVKSPKMRTRIKRKRSIRKQVRGTAQRPRLSVFRSAKHIYVQAIDDETHRVLAAASDVEGRLALSCAGKKKVERARAVGNAIGERLVAKKVTAIVFDRNGYLYHGRVAQVAEGARQAGLKF